MTDHTARIAAELAIAPEHVAAVIRLLDEGATIPFIARYRKEATGSLDEVAVAAIRDRREALAELDKRREAVLASLTERGLLTPELHTALAQAATLTTLEDLYLPYRPKRRTRATMARERGLEPLADWLLTQPGNGQPDHEAQSFINPDLDVPDIQSALAGARDILAERFAEDAAVRERMRGLYARQGQVQAQVVKGKEEEGGKFRDYFAWNEAASKAPSHRILAVLRGEEEGILRLHLRPEAEDTALALLRKAFVRGDHPAAQQVAEAAADSYTRLLAPSMENELRTDLKKRADTEAIRVFSENLRQLLLAPPLGPKRLMAVDPGFRTGCKVVCLSPEGRLLEYLTVNPHAGSAAEKDRAGQELLRLIRVHHIEAVAVGNGTAGRETEDFIRALPGRDASVPIILVSESGASVYSASDLARQEFPDLDLTYRGAVSIGRRLSDPLAELVKIDPKAIGVGQYQHDVNQADLKRGLDDVVMSCVNSVGVELNTASEALLSYVSGLGPTLARNIVAHRHEHGMFATRKDLLKVPRLGPKAFEQAAGFLRLRDGAHPLDRSAVHPEQYPLVERMAKDLRTTIPALIADPDLRRTIDLNRNVSDKAGLPTLRDIMAELEKPGRDPRGEFQTATFTEGVNEIKDLQLGMILEGVVSNVANFGAFVDIGVHQDGLVHISALANKFIQDPREVVKAGDVVKVKVMEIDAARKRIALTMRLDDEPGSTAKRDRPSENNTRKDTRPQRSAPREQAQGNSAMADAFAKLKR